MMRGIFYLILFCSYTQVYSQQTIFKLSYALKGHCENSFDYNTIHNKWVFKKFDNDSILAYHYQLNNYISPFENKFLFQTAYFIHFEELKKLIDRIEEIIPWDDKDQGITYPRHPSYNCFTSPPQIIASVKIEKLNKSPTEYFFDLTGEQNVEILAGFQETADAFLNVLTPFENKD
ncbi:hypothetical protein GCM10011506_12300 [Marivirga lumbricoides]|uniref:DUF4105 domain-containing protein n=1 Tax=Marivirga lumbricoides TaxID=1046115 RepID=A0ABQ1LVN5_9BACT|nr:hypothetical protein GCM10011506_12300 [Marivirga lumbricoides]